MYEICAKTFFNGNFCALQVFLYALVSRTHSLEGILGLMASDNWQKWQFGELLLITVSIRKNRRN